MDGTRSSDAIRAFLDGQKEENSYIRHYEETRFKITQLTVTLSGILLGILRFGEHQYTLFIGVFIAALGLLGALVSIKYTERADRHAALSRAYRRAASKLGPKPNKIVAG